MYEPEASFPRQTAVLLDALLVRDFLKIHTFTHTSSPNSVILKNFSTKAAATLHEKSERRCSGFIKPVLPSAFTVMTSSSRGFTGPCLRPSRCSPGLVMPLMVFWMSERSAQVAVSPVLRFATSTIIWSLGRLQQAGHAEIEVSVDIARGIAQGVVLDEGLAAAPKKTLPLQENA